MSYTCRVYKSSGFNAINRPDRPALLNSVTYIDLPALDLLQDAALDSVRVRATFAQISTADYCKIGNWYYAIVGIRMTSPDTAELSLSPDYILSAGDISTLSFLDGITERVHVAQSSDTFGAYTEDDPLTAPSQPLDITIENVKLGNGTFVTIIESAIDLIGTAASTDALTYVDPLGNEVTVPNYSSLSVYTDHLYGGTHKTASYVVPTPTQGTPDNIQKGIDRARALGVESAIIGQYNVPAVFMSGYSTGFQQRLVGDQQSNTSAITFVQDANAKNMRVNYGAYTKFGMLTAGGNKAEFNAEDIYHSGDTTPRIITKPDVRKDGCPYHRFQYYKGDSSADGFWRNCLAGAPWEQVPIVYNAKSSNALDRLQFETERKTSWSTFDRNLKMNSQTAVFAGAAAGLAKGGPAMGIGAAIGSAVTAGYRGVNDILNFYEQDYATAMNFAASQVVKPDIQFPYNTDIMRDALGNGCLVYRYLYSASDIARIDKLLTMYGYRVTKPLEASDLTNRQKFNFVRAYNVSVTGLPKWWADGIAAQFATGIRIWHVLPDPSIYTSGQS